MSRSVMDEIKQEVEQNKVLIYMKGSAEMPRCGFSAAAVDAIQRLGVPFHAVNVLDDPEKWQAVKVFSQWPTIPQIYVGGEFLGGCDIIREMYANGELQQKVEAATETAS